MVENQMSHGWNQSLKRLWESPKPKVTWSILHERLTSISKFVTHQILLGTKNPFQQPIDWSLMIRTQSVKRTQLLRKYTCSSLAKGKICSSEPSIEKLKVFRGDTPYWLRCTSWKNGHQTALKTRRFDMDLMIIQGSILIFTYNGCLLKSSTFD